MKAQYLSALVALLPFSGWATDCQCDHTLSANQSYFDGNQMNVQPGDRVCIPAGERSQMKLENFVGTAERPIIFVNCGGQAVIKGNQWYGIGINRSEFFRLTGSGDSEHTYGIKVVDSGAMGIQIGEYSTDFEVDHIEIADVGFAGVMAKTDPSCDRRDLRNFVQRNTVLHDLYIHDVGGEGMYLGYSWYPAREGVDCSGNMVNLYSHRLEGVKIYDNILERTGWDGIQLGCATQEVEIHHNVIQDYGTEQEQYQANGMQIGTGTTGDVYSNHIADGKGDGAGIIIFGIGDNRFYNNVIVRSNSFGIYLNDREYDTGREPFQFINNTIVLSQNAGIRMSLQNSEHNLFYNNLIVSASENYLEWGEAQRDESNNLFYKNIASAQFVDPALGDYRLRENSPAVDTGKDVSDFGVTRGYRNTRRPQGDHYDVGAYEFSLAEAPIILSTQSEVSSASMLFPNPAKDHLTLPVSSLGHSAEATIMNISGKIMQQVQIKPTSDHTSEVALPHGLPSGLYYLRFSSNESSLFFRFYKQ